MTDYKQFLFGAIAGAIIVPIIGFTTLGWRLDSKAMAMAHDAATAEVQKVLVPVCIAQFKADPEVAAHTATFKAEKYSYPRVEFISNGGWATLPGMSDPVSGLASSCAQELKASL